MLNYQRVKDTGGFKIVYYSLGWLILQPFVKVRDRARHCRPPYFIYHDILIDHSNSFSICILFVGWISTHLLYMFVF